MIPQKRYRKLNHFLNSCIEGFEVLKPNELNDYYFQYTIKIRVEIFLMPIISFETLKIFKIFRPKNKKMYLGTRTFQKGLCDDL